MKTAAKDKKLRPAASSSDKRLIDSAAKKIVKNYGKTLKLLAKE